jgi:hypothetical protein
MALVPNQWSGSVQQYYHFLLGYLAPMQLWLDRADATQITVRDCGPMNRWFTALPDDVDVEIMQVGHFLHVFAGRLQPAKVLRGLDFPQEFNSRKLAHFRSLMLKNLNVEDLPGSRWTVIDRSVTDPFYSTAESEIDLAGAARRSVPNLRTWAESVKSEIPLDVFEATDLDIREQVSRFTKTAVLIGQHGAGLAHMVFMKPGGVVVEIHPPLPAEAIETFSLLAAACGHEYVRVPQSGVHVEIDEALLTNEVRKYC